MTEPAPPTGGREPVQFEHDQVNFVVDDLSQQVAAQAKIISILKGEKAQLEGFIKANASALGMEVGQDGSVGPKRATPNRAARRARVKPAQKL